MPELVKRYENKYSPMMIKDFLLYWEEGDRYKKEKVFDVEKRLERWKRQQDKWDWEKSQKNVKIEETPRKVIPQVNSGFNSIGSLLNKYK